IVNRIVAKCSMILAVWKIRKGDSTVIPTRRAFLASAASAAAFARTGNSKNVITNGQFHTGNSGGMPEGWEVVCPNPALAPLFRQEDKEGRPTLLASGNGRKECFGFARQRFTLEGGKTWHFRVVLETHGLKDLNLHLVHGLYAEKLRFNDGIFEYRRDGNL